MLLSANFVYVCVRRWEKPQLLMKHTRKIIVNDAQENRLNNPLLTTTVFKRYLDLIFSCKVFTFYDCPDHFFHKKMIWSMTENGQMSFVMICVKDTVVVLVRSFWQCHHCTAKIRCTSIKAATWPCCLGMLASYISFFSKGH